MREFAAFAAFVLLVACVISGIVKAHHPDSSSYNQPKVARTCITTRTANGRYSHTGSSGFGYVDDNATAPSYACS